MKEETRWDSAATVRVAPEGLSPSTVSTTTEDSPSRSAVIRWVAVLTASSAEAGWPAWRRAAWTTVGVVASASTRELSPSASVEDDGAADSVCIRTWAV